MRWPSGTQKQQSPASTMSDASNSALPCSTMRADSLRFTCGPRARAPFQIHRGSSLVLQWNPGRLPVNPSIARPAPSAGPSASSAGGRIGSRMQAGRGHLVAPVHVVWRCPVDARVVHRHVVQSQAPASVAEHQAPPGGAAGAPAPPPSAVCTPHPCPAVTPARPAGAPPRTPAMVAPPSLKHKCTGRCRTPVGGGGGGAGGQQGSEGRRGEPLQP